MPTTRSLLALLILAATLVACGSGERGGGDAGEPAAASAERGGDRAPPGRPEAPLLAGGERIVFVGDSLAVTSPPSYPDLLPAALGERTPGVEVVNLAEPGTETGDWLPGGVLFERRLGPELERADVVAVTLGGNDLQSALGATDGLDGLERAPAAVAEVRGGLDRFERRLKRLFETIRTRAPDAAIVFVGYPDYSEASIWREAGGSAGTLALRLGLGALADAAADAGPDLAIDMREASARRGVDSLLADSEHLGPAGHELYARVLARKLSGRGPG